MSLNGVIVIRKRQVRAELYLRGPTAKPFFARLFNQKVEMERELGYSLDWLELPEGQGSRIAISSDADPANEADWPRRQD
jgi:hypothetical protein